MQTLERLTAGDLAAAVTAYRDALRAHQEAINRLNVYPVPDGDTGTNMALTVESMVRELAERGDRADMPMVAEAISYGSLMGARGNSGGHPGPDLPRARLMPFGTPLGWTPACWRTGWLEPLTGRTRRFSTPSKGPS